VAIYLDTVTASDLRGDRERFKLVTEYNSLLARSTALQRHQVIDRLREIVSARARPYKFEGWQRVVDFQYSDHPLSARGSVVSETGGRFNIGDIAPMNLRPFPALYLASGRALAFFEKYGVREDRPDGKLTAHEIVLSQGVPSPVSKFLASLKHV
jgi:hypothetical protein